MADGELSPVKLSSGHRNGSTDPPPVWGKAVSLAQDNSMLGVVSMCISVKAQLRGLVGPPNVEL